VRSRLPQSVVIDRFYYKIDFITTVKKGEIPKKTFSTQWSYPFLGLRSGLSVDGRLGPFPVLSAKDDGWVILPTHTIPGPLRMGGDSRLILLLLCRLFLICSGEIATKIW
jgi:hypothetical protein